MGPDGTEAFLEAVRQDDAAMLRRLLAKRPGMAGMVLADGGSPVTMAARLGCTEALAVLLEAGVAAWTSEGDPEGGTPTALMLAAGRGDAAAVALLLEHGVDPSLRDAEGRTAVDWAREAGHAALAACLETGAEMERSLLSGAATDAPVADAPVKEPGPAR